MFSPGVEWVHTPAVSSRETLLGWIMIDGIGVCSLSVSNRKSTMEVVCVHCERHGKNGYGITVKGDDRVRDEKCCKVFLLNVIFFLYFG